MKMILVVLALLPQLTFAADMNSAQTTTAGKLPKKTGHSRRELASEATLAQMNAMTTAATPQMTSTSAGKVVITTNIVDLSNGNGNLDAHILANDTMAFSLNYISTSKKEKVANITGGEVKVDRHAYGIGATWFARPFSNQTTVLVSPSLQFGQKSDLLNVENKTGIRMKVSTIYKASANFALEAGVRADDLEDTFKGEAVVGVGFIL